MSEIRPRFRRIDGLSIRYAKSDGESLYAYQATWSRMAEGTHLVAVDLPGFGHSELRAELLTPRATSAGMTRTRSASRRSRSHEPRRRTGFETMK